MTQRNVFIWGFKHHCLYLCVCFYRSPCSSMYSTMCFTSAGTSWPLTVWARVTSSNGTPKTRVVLAEPPPSLPGNGDTPFLMASSSPQSRQDLTSAERNRRARGERFDKKRNGMIYKIRALVRDTSQHKQNIAFNLQSYSHVKWESGKNTITKTDPMRRHKSN